MAKKSEPAAEASTLTEQQKDLQMRVQLFDKDFQALQNKYKLRAIAQVQFPGGAVLTVPIQVFPFGPTQVATPAPKEDEAVDPNA